VRGGHDRLLRPVTNKRAPPLAAKRSKQAPLLSAFISHAKADEKKARAIAEGLESRGFKCWIAPRDVRAGRSYGDEIIRGIESTRSFVLVLSKASNDSAFVAREVERAVSKKKPIFAVRLANVEPAPALELFVSGTQWIDAFPGRLGAHIGRLANLLAEEEGGEPLKPEPGSRLPTWVIPLGAAAAVLLVLGGGLALWPGYERGDPSLFIRPVWFPKKSGQVDEQIASAEKLPDVTLMARSEDDAQAAPSDDTEMIIGGKSQSQPRENSAAGLGLAGRDPDFQSCETASGDEALAACDRAIASGKFTGRNLSYLYSDRGFMRMQGGEIDRALVDLNEAARIDSGNFYAFWNRGAVYAAKREFDRAQEDFATALALKPDKTSKAKIEEALNAVTEGAKAAKAQTSDPSVISDPSRFWGSQEGVSGSAASSFPADAAMPSLTPTLPARPMPAIPAAPSMGPAVVPPGR